MKKSIRKLLILLLVSIVFTGNFQNFAADSIDIPDDVKKFMKEQGIEIPSIPPMPSIPPIPLMTPGSNLHMTPIPKATPTPNKTSVASNQNVQKKPTINIENIMKYDTTGKSTKNMLSLAKIYFDSYSKNVEPAIISKYKGLINFTPRFDSKIKNNVKGLEISSNAAQLLLAKDTSNYCIATAAAGFSLAYGQHISAHNLAASLYIKSMYLAPKGAKIDQKILTQATKLRNDAALFYQYSVSLNPKSPDELTALGNVYMDLNRGEDARVCFETATKYNPDNMLAAEGLASYYMSIGNIAKAKAVMSNPKLKKPMIFGFVKSKTENMQKMPETKSGATVESIKNDINTLKKLTPVSTADFLDGIDPVDAQSMRLGIDHATAENLLKLPNPASLADASTYEIYYNNYDRFSYYNELMLNFIKSWSSYNDAYRKHLNLPNNSWTQADIEKYYQKVLGNTANIMDMLNNGELDPDKIASGDRSGIDKYLGMLGDMDISSKTFQSKLAAEGNIDHYIRWYNSSAYNKKFGTYNAYFNTLYKELRQIVLNDNEDFSKRIYDLNEQERIAFQYGGSEALRIKFALMRNEERNKKFQKSYGIIIKKYVTEIQPMIEQMWESLMPHVLLTKDEKTREALCLQVSESCMNWYTSCVGLVMASAEAGDWENVTADDLDYASKQEAKENEAAKLREKINAAYKTAKVPNGSLFLKALGKFTYEKKIGPVKISINVNSISISGSSGINKGKLSYNWGTGTVSSSVDVMCIKAQMSYNNRTGALDGGVGVGVTSRLEGQVMGKSASLAIGAETMITFKSNVKTGEVSEVDWTGTATAGASFGGISAGGTYNASVMHGNSFTPMVSGSTNGVSF